MGREEEEEVGVIREEGMGLEVGTVTQGTTMVRREFILAAFSLLPNPAPSSGDLGRALVHVVVTIPDPPPPCSCSGHLGPQFRIKNIYLFFVSTENLITVMSKININNN